MRGHPFAVLVLGFWATSTLVRGQSSTGDPPPRPNVVLIVADDLGWADTTPYGHTSIYRTPNVERLARGGMRFTQAYAASPVCSPTRASILTGQHPARLGITLPNCQAVQTVLQAVLPARAPASMRYLEPRTVTRLDTRHRTLAADLHDAGYATAHIGKWHLGRDPYSPRQHGFDVDLPHWAGGDPPGGYFAPWEFDDFENQPAEPHQHLEDRMAAEAVAFLERHTGQPFFLNYWMFSVHAPFEAKSELVDAYRPRIDANAAQRSPTYAAMVETMDAALGTVLDALDRTGLAERTLVIFCADNGGDMYSTVDGTTPTSNAPLRGGKGTLWEGGIRVPWIVRWPGVVAAGSTSDAVVQSTDLCPTVLDLLGVRGRDDRPCDGVSIAPALRGGALARDAVFWFLPHAQSVPDALPPAVAVRCGDWKLIRVLHGGDHGAHRWLLFDLHDDPGEQHDLAALQPERVRELDARIDAFLADTNAVCPRPNPDYDPDFAALATAARDPRTNRVVPAADPPLDPALQGWRARGCTAAVENGIATFRASNDMPLIGLDAHRHVGPTTVTLRIRCPAGHVRIEWVRQGDKKPAGSVLAALRAGDWQQVEVTLPASGPLGTLRILLPPVEGPTEIDWISIRSAAGAPSERSERMDFGDAAKANRG